EADSAYSLENLQNKFFRHLLSSSGTQDLVFDISFSGNESDTAQVQHVIDETKEFLKDKLPTVSADFLGQASFRYYFKKIMYQDSIYNVLILLLIVIFFRLVFGTWISGCLLTLTLLGATIILYGTMALLGIS